MPTAERHHQGLAPSSSSSLGRSGQQAGLATMLQQRCNNNAAPNHHISDNNNHRQALIASLRAPLVSATPKASVPTIMPTANAAATAATTVAKKVEDYSREDKANLNHGDNVTFDSCFSDPTVTSLIDTSSGSDNSSLSETAAENESKMLEVIEARNTGTSSPLRIVSFYDCGEEVKDHTSSHRSVSRTAGFQLASSSAEDSSDSSSSSSNCPRKVIGEIEETIDYEVDPASGAQKCRRHSRTMNTTERRQSMPGVSMTVQTSQCAVEEFVSSKDLLPELMQHLHMGNNVAPKSRLPRHHALALPVPDKELEISEVSEVEDSPPTPPEPPRSINFPSAALRESGMARGLKLPPPPSAKPTDNNDYGRFGRRREMFASPAVGLWRSTSVHANDHHHHHNYSVRRYSNSSNSSTSSTAGAATNHHDNYLSNTAANFYTNKLNSFPTTLGSSFARPSYSAGQTSGYSRYASMRNPSATTNSRAGSSQQPTSALLNHHIRRSSDARAYALLAKYL